MPNSELATTSEPRALSNSSVVRKWIVTFGEIFGREITPELVKVWCGLLSDIPPDALNLACEGTAKSCKFFPSPGEIRAKLDQVGEQGRELEAEHAWRHALDWIGRWYQPDVEISWSAPELPPEITHAIRAAGGMHMLFGCPEADLVWRKRDFIADYSRTEELGRKEHLMTDGAAKRILATLQADSSRQLAPARESPSFQPNKAEVRSALDKAVLAPAAIAEMSEEEWSAGSASSNGGSRNG